MAVSSGELPVRPEPSFHPEATADSRILEWTVNPQPVVGLLDSAFGDALPTGLSRLLREGKLTRVAVDGNRLTTVLGEGQRWNEVGPALWDALYTDLSVGPWTEPESSDEKSPSPAGQELPLESTPGVASEEDAQIAAEVEALLAGSVGRIAASHGGSIVLISVHQGVVEVGLRGACRGCPAAAATLGRRIEAHLRRAHPGVREVRRV